MLTSIANRYVPCQPSHQAFNGNRSLARSGRHAKRSNLVSPTSLYQRWRLILVRTVFLEPPHIVEKVDMPWAQNTSEFDSDATTEKEEQTPETTPRAWWLSTNDRTAYRSGLIARWSFASKLMHDQSLTRRYGISTVSW